MQKISRRHFVTALPSLALLLSALPSCTTSRRTHKAIKPDNDSLRDLLRFAEENGDDFELSNNENPLGPSPLALTALEEAKRYRYLHRYSAHTQLYNALKEKVAKTLKLETDFISVLPGTTDILLRLVEVHTSTNKALVQMKPEYFALAHYVRRIGSRLHEIETGFDGNIDIKKFIDTKAFAGMLYFSNPNNPLGITNPPEKILALAEAFPNIPVVIDEAYIHYLGPEYEAQSMLIYTSKYRNLIVLRTFSKIYGLAGLRIGLAICHPDAHRQLKLVAHTRWSVSSSSMIAAYAALDDNAHLRAGYAHNQRMLSKINEYAQKNGLKIANSKSLCTYLALPNPEESLRKLAEQGIFFNDNALASPYLRLTMGSDQDLDLFIRTLTK